MIFIGCIACKKRQTIFVYDSLLNYHVPDQLQALQATAKYFEELWSTPMTYQLQLCDTQEKDDCGVHTVNNILGGLGHPYKFTRKSMGDLVSKNRKK